LKKYLVEQHGEDLAKELHWEDPLFLNYHGRNAGERFDKVSFERVMRQVAPKTGIVSKERLEHASRNPLSPRSLRASFSNRLKAVGCDSDYIDYWMGHTSRYGGACAEAERKDYCKYAYLALEPKHVTPEVETEMLETKGRVDELKTRMLALLEENRQLKKTVDKLEGTLDWLVSEVRTFQRQTLERMGDSPEVIEKTMQKFASGKEDYLKSD
jgi:hypothetical protein